jgi:hypothetical protein
MSRFLKSIRDRLFTRRATALTETLGLACMAVHEGPPPVPRSPARGGVCPRPRAAVTQRWVRALDPALDPAH